MAKPTHAAAFQDLRQRAGIAEHVRQPEHPAVDAELVLEELLAVHELADQALAAGDVGIGLDPHAAIGDDVARLDRGFKALVQLGVVLLEHPVQVRLALQELELGVFVDQGQLVDGGARNLALGLLQRPQPGHVDVGVPESVQGGHGGAVLAFQQRLQAVPPGADGFQHFVFGQFGVDDQCRFHQGLVDFSHAQAERVDPLAQLEQGGEIDRQPGKPPRARRRRCCRQRSSESARLRHGLDAVGNGAIATVIRP